MFAGNHKNDFSPHGPLTPQASTALQAEVDRLYAIFATQVTAMRWLDVDAVRTAGLCMNGSHAWFERHGLDFRAFLREGLDAQTLLATNDTMALRVVNYAKVHARTRQEKH